MVKKRQAFTLVELMIVMTIIGILSTIVVVNYGNAKAKSRDARRMADISSIAAALELYKMDNKRYPDAAGTDTYIHACHSAANCWSNLLPSTYISPLPKDPINKWNYTGGSEQWDIASFPGTSAYVYMCADPDGSYCDSTASNAQAYVLGALLEIPLTSDTNYSTANYGHFWLVPTNWKMVAGTPFK